MIGSSFPLPCGQTLSNRLAKAAMSEEMATVTGEPGAALVRLYKAWAEGGTGLLITGNIMVDPSARENPRNVLLTEDSDLSFFTPWIAAGTCRGNHLWAQLNHPGRQTPRFVNPHPVAPSEGIAVKQFRLFGEPRELTVNEIQQIITRFAISAALAKKVGFTGVQIHGAHGYLINQFLSPLINKRTDEWGGSLPNRARFLYAIIDAVRAAVGPHYPIGVKLNSADFQRGGFDENDSIEVITHLQTLGIDLLEISGGNYEAPAMLNVHDSSRQREAYFLDFSRKIRGKIQLPLMVTGGFRSRDVMQQALQENVLDIIGLARPLAIEPDLSLKLIGGESLGSTIVPRSFGIKKINFFAEGGYYLAQMTLLSQGKITRPDLGPWQAAWLFIWHQMRDRWQYTRQHSSHVFPSEGA